MNKSISSEMTSEKVNIPASKILIVDDKEENLFALKELITPLGAEVVLALSGTEALSILAKDPDFSLILMDVQMPKLDGFNTVKLIRMHPSTKNIAIIYITAIFKDARYIHKGYESGAVDYMCKPIDSEILVSKARVFLDIDQQKRKLQELLDETTKLEKGKNLILEHAREGIIAVDKYGTVFYANPAAERLLEFHLGNLRRISILSILQNSELDNTSWPNSVFQTAIINNEVVRKNDTHIYKYDNTPLNVQFSFGPYATEHGSGGVFIFQDISAQRKLEKTLLHIANHDSLTGLPNRILFREILIGAIQRSLRNHSSIMVISIDLDNFKNINDELGHVAGDALLVTISSRLKAFGRNVDSLSRLGGDEFSIIFEDVNDDLDIDNLARRILDLIREPIKIEGHNRFISCSVGVVKYPEYGHCADDIIKAADIAMYKAKSLGRNQYVIFEAKDKNIAIQRHVLENDLKASLKTNQLCCFYQPIFEAKTGELHAFEALVRWHHPSRGLVMPSEIMPLAEESNLIVEISNIILGQAFSQLSKWIDLGIWPSLSRMSINVSVRQFYRGIILQQVEQALKKNPVELKFIDFEITESTVMSEPEAVIDILNSLRQKGMTIAIDDFGTGYSSLMYLRRLPINTIKIDRSFIEGIGVDKDDEKIIESTIALAHSLGVEVVSEGVETIDQEKFLIASGSNYMQGNLYSKPMNERDAEDWLRRYTNRTRQRLQVI